MQLPILIVLLFVCTNGDRSISSDHDLHSSLEYFDTLHKDDMSHEILYQSVTSGYHLRMVKFRTLGRYFHLHLSPHRDLFSDDFSAYRVDRHGNMTLHSVDKNRFYSGHVLGESRSSVVVHVSDVGVLIGMVATDTEVYHFEPSRRFISTPHDYHMIAYRLSDVKYDFSNTSVDYEHAPFVDDGYNRKQPIGEIVQNSATNRHGGGRLRRALRGNTCQMYVVADTSFYNSIGNSQVDDTIVSMVNIIASLDQATYRSAIFNLSSGITARGIGVQVSAVMVHTAFNDDVVRFPYNRDDNADIDVVLNRFSTLPPDDPLPNEPQQDRYCLAHLFTFQSFSQNRLGLANIASPSFGATGGVCSSVVRVGGNRMVYNTGVSSFRIGRRTLVRVEAQLVVAHEIGHNWGSFHDTSGCGENYLMYPFASSGSNPRNFRFSQCSLRMIAEVLTSKGGCFSDVPQTKCGNFLSEDNEDCDAGLNRNDSCCDDECHHKPGAVCSDVNDNCCVDCQVASSDVLCHVVSTPSGDCTADTFCNGINITCPPLGFQPEGTECIFGQCVLVSAGSVNTTCASLCVVQNQTSCLCEGDNACRVCCRNTSSSPCTPIPAMDGGNVPFLSDGVLCQDGRCDNGTCATEPQDGIQKLFRFFTTLSGDAVKRAIEENIVGFVLTCAVFVWVPVSLLIHFAVDRRLYKRVLKHLHHHDKVKIHRMARRPKGLHLELTPLIPPDPSRPTSFFSASK